MKVALLGGAFDPPHIGHILCVANVLNAGVVDEVWLVPSGDARYDKKPNAPAATRKRMLELVLKNEFASSGKVKLESSQIDSASDQCFTIDLVRALRAKHPKNEFHLIVGSDLVKSIDGWKEGEALKKEVSFIVIARPASADGSEKLNINQLRTTTIDAKFTVSTDVSSSKVRENISMGRETSGMIPYYLRELIRAEKLYR